MKVRFQAVRWEIERGITIREFCAHLKTANALEWQSAERIIRIADRGKKIAIMVVSDLKTKSHTKLVKRQDGEFEVSVESGAKGTNAHPNFFLIDPSSGKGIYVQYWGSFAFSSFSQMCAHQYRDMREARANQTAKESGTTQEAAKKQFSRALRYMFLASKGEIDSLLRKFGSISSLLAEVNSPEIIKSRFAPLEGQTRSHSIRLSFRRESKGIKEAIKQTVKNASDFLRLRLSGKGRGEDAKSLTVDLLSQLAVLDEHPFDSIASKLACSSKNFKSAGIFDMIESTWAANKSIIDKLSDRK